MKKIDIGTCVPASLAEKWIPALLNLGYECFAINFHMSLHGIKLEELAEKVQELLKDSNAYISNIGFYCNPLENEDHRKTVEHFIDCAKLFGTSMVSTFAGGLEGKSVEESIPAYKSVFSELAKRAEAENVKIAIENCEMSGSWKHVTCNIAFNPKAWEMMFNEVPSPAIGLEWEPGHQMIQLIDPIAQLKKWVGKIIHIHGKDGCVDMNAVRTYGISGAHPFVMQRTPGFGDVDWRQIFTILYQNNYSGDISVEGFHDPIYRYEWEMTGQKHAFDYLNLCRGGEIIPNPSEIVFGR